MEKKTRVLATVSDFEYLQQDFVDCWVKDEEVPYNPYGTDSVKIIHLVKYAEGERESLEAEKAAMAPEKYRFVDSFAREQSEPAGPDNRVDKLIGEGYEVIDHSAKDVMLVKRKKPQVSMPPVIMDGYESTVITKVTPSDMPTSNVSVGESVTVQFKSAETGEVVKEVMQEETPKPKEPVKEDYGPFSPDLLGCVECAHECNEAKKQVLWEQMCEAREWQCPVWKPKEAVK